MADQGDINYNVSADVSQANAELQKLRSSITAVTGNLTQSQNTIEAAVKRMTADIDRSISKAKAGSDQLLASLRRLDRVQGNTIGSQSRGPIGNQITGAAGQQLINEARNSAENVTARITNELVSQYTQRIKAMDRQVEARIRQTQFSAQQAVQNADPTLLAARNVRSQRANERTIYAAQNGEAAAGMRNTLDRIGSNGGADIVTIQAKLLAGYAALSLAMNGIRDTAQFVVQLDAEFRQFQAITATTNFEMIGLKKSLIDVSEESKFTALEIAKAATVMGQAGFSANEVAESIGSIATLATAAGSSLAESVDVVTSTMSIFNLQTSQAADVSNTLTAALNLSKLSMDKLVLGFQYAGNTAAQLGITYQELTGVLGALANSGIRSGSTLGTGLRQLLIDIQNPTEKFTKTLRELGLSQQDVNIESNGLIPVLNTLKEAGFGSAQAFESFEVRAAAAFAALSNNTELATQLQNSFVLSSAAAEANAIQMESLSNTYAKFQSVVGTVAYTALEPLIDVLQDALNAFANLLAGLNQYPALLNLIAIGFTAVGTAIALTSMSALIRGLLQAIPLFGGIAAALSGTTVAAGGAATAMEALSLAFRANPIILFVSVLASAAVGLYAFANAGLSTSERIDILKGQVNTFGGQVETANGQIEAIDQTISNLIRQKAALDRDPLMRTAKILEVKQAFKEISGEVNTTTGTVEDLIEALRNLQNMDFSNLSDSIAATVSGNEAVIEGYKTLFEEQSRSAEQNVSGNIGHLLDEDTPFTTLNIGGDETKFNEAVTNLYRKTLGEAFAGFAAIALNPETLPTDVSSAQSILRQIDTKSNQLTTRQSILDGNRRAGTLTDAEAEELGNIPRYLEMLKLLKDNLEPLVTTRTNIAATSAENDILRTNQISATVQENPGYKDIQAARDALESDINNGLNGILDRSADMSSEDLVSAYAELETTINAKVAEIATKTKALADAIVAQSNGTITTEQVQNALAGDNASLASLQARVSTGKSNANVDYQKILEQDRKSQLAVIDDQIQLQLGQQRRAHTEAELDEIEKYIKEKFDQKRQIVRALYDSQTNAATTQDEKRNLLSQLTKDQSDINREEAEATRRLAEDRTDQQIDLVEEQKAAVDQDIAVMEKKLQELATAIGRASSEDAMNALIAQWNQVYMAQQGLVTESGALGITSSLLSTTGKAPPKSQAALASQAMQTFIGMGYTQAQAAGIVGNLMSESGLNPTARGDSGKAFGLAQLHPDRQARLDDYISQNGGKRDDFRTQLKFIDYELKNFETKAYKDLIGQTTAAGAADSFRRLYERPSLDPVRGNHAGRVANAKGLIGDFASDNQTSVQDQTNLRENIRKGRINTVNEDVTTNVGKFNQQIQTLMAQAGATNNPDSVKKIVASVDELYNKIIEEKKRAFDTENKEAIQKGDPDILRQREALIEGLKADQNQKTSQLLDTYWKALDEKINEPLVDAQAALANAQKPENASLFTQADILNLEDNVRLAEQKVLVDELAASEQVLADVRAQLAATPDGTPEHNYWLLEEAHALEKVNELTRAKNAADAATSQQGPSVVAAIQSATQAWAIQNGILDETGKMIPLAKQVENAWSGVLDMLTTGFSTLFTDLVSGTMTAQEAFQKFALSVIQGFIQMIAKALAMQVVMGLMNGLGGEGGGGLGSIIGSLLGTVAPGAANGEYIRGAAIGEVIPGTANRDSVLRRVMPGEMILRRSAVSSIGQGALEKLNNLGATSISGDAALGAPANDNPAGGVVNVYVVQKDNMPQLGEKDVVTFVANDIQKRGTLKQLIKSVSIGSI